MLARVNDPEVEVDPWRASVETGFMTNERGLVLTMTSHGPRLAIVDLPATQRHGSQTLGCTQHSASLARSTEADPIAQTGS